MPSKMDTIDSNSLNKKIIIEAGKANENYWKDLRSFKGLFYFLAWRDVLVRYKQTSIGIAWAIIRPLFTISALCLVRLVLDKWDTNSGIPMPLLIAAGIMPWQLFSSAFSEISSSLLSNANLISKVYFPRIIVPISTLVVCLIDFLISFSIVLALMLYYQYLPGIQILLLPVFLIAGLLAASGMGLLVAALNVKYRDFKFIVPFIVQFGMYVSPVMYSSNEIYMNNHIPQWVKFIYSMNPAVSVIDGFRWCVFGEQVPLTALSFLLSLIIGIIFLIIGVKTFRKMERSFADDI